MLQTRVTLLKIGALIEIDVTAAETLQTLRRFRGASLSLYNNPDNPS